MEWKEGEHPSWMSLMAVSLSGLCVCIRLPERLESDPSSIPPKDLSLIMDGRPRRRPHKRYTQQKVFRGRRRKSEYNSSRGNSVTTFNTTCPKDATSGGKLSLRKHT